MYMYHCSPFTKYQHFKDSMISTYLIVLPVLCTNVLDYCLHFFPPPAPIPQRYLALDDRVAWAYFEFTEELLSGETIEEWITLNGKQGDGQEGTINVILSFTVSFYKDLYMHVHVTISHPLTRLYNYDQKLIELAWTLLCVCTLHKKEAKISDLSIYYTITTSACTYMCTCSVRVVYSATKQESKTF